MESNALLEHIKFSRKGIKNIVGDRNQAAISQQWWLYSLLPIIVEYTATKVQ